MTESWFVEDAALAVAETSETIVDVEVVIDVTISSELVVVLEIVSAVVELTLSIVEVVSAVDDDETVEVPSVK